MKQNHSSAVHALFVVGTCSLVSFLLDALDPETANAKELPVRSARSQLAASAKAASTLAREARLAEAASHSPRVHHALLRFELAERGLERLARLEHPPYRALVQQDCRSTATECDATCTASGPGLCDAGPYHATCEWLSPCSGPSGLCVHETTVTCPALGDPP